MAATEQLFIASAQGGSGTQTLSRWRVSLPLLVAAVSYLYVLTHAALVLADGDTLWHVAAGRWIVEHGVIPTADPFSSTMRGAPWTAHEWLSEVLLAFAQAAGDWKVVVVLTGVAFAAATAVLTRALLRWLEPLYALLFAALAIALSLPHVLARPHVLAMPLLVLWTAQLVRARDEERAPAPWILPVMTVWANLHGGFTLGVALAAAFGVEAVWAADRDRRQAVALRWGLFVAGAVAAALLTPNGVRGFLFTWQVMAESAYALAAIGEWHSPNFQLLQPLTIWIASGLALLLYQGLRLPPVRIALVVGLVYLALKHVRNIELLGLVFPLVVAQPFSQQWQARRAKARQWSGADRLLGRLAGPAGAGALVAAPVLAAALTLGLLHGRQVQPPSQTAPVAAVDAAQRAGVSGNVLNAYNWGGYLVYRAIPPFIDGRADMYGDPFFKRFTDAVSLAKPEELPRLLDQYHVNWTLLHVGTPAVALLDRLPGWHRVYADDISVVHARNESGR